MKINIKGNSLRIRLNRRDWDTFTSSWKVEQDVPFGYRQKLIYCVKVTDQSTIMEVSLNHPYIMVIIPRAMAKSWMEGEERIIKGEVPVADDETLKVYLERRASAKIAIVDVPESAEN